MSGKKDSLVENVVVANASSTKSNAEVRAIAYETESDSSQPDGNDGTDQQLIDLTTALMLTAGQSPQIQFARARIQEASAQWERANALKLPSIRAGLNYNKHDGRIQDVAGSIIETSRGSYFHGFGANAVGAGSPAIPGIISQFHVADAIFQPKIAERTYCARKSESRTAINDALHATAVAYVELLRTHQELAIARDIFDRARVLEKTTREFEKVGAGLSSDHDRAMTELALRENDVYRAQECSRVSSSRLAQQVRWDQLKELVPSEDTLVPISLVEQDSLRADLVATALTQRPELAEAKHLVGAAVERLRRECNAPLVPSILLGASYGGQAGGLGSSLSNYGDRIDFDAAAYWELRQLGVGESAIRREAQSRVAQARAQELQLLDRVAREVVESHIQTQFRHQQIEVAEHAIQSANKSYERNLERIRNGQGLPIELLQAIQALATARREYVRTVADYNIAQFNLQRNLGWPVQLNSDDTTLP